jgi:hypothetical protein
MTCRTDAVSLCERRDPAIVKKRTAIASAILLTTAVCSVAALHEAPRARADAVAYLIDVTVRPGYRFGGAEDAIAYGRGVCDKLGSGRHYSDLIGDVETDIAASDDYQASYLVTAAVNELCPSLIWQLRNSAAHYRPAP